MKKHSFAGLVQQFTLSLPSQLKRLHKALKTSPSEAGEILPCHTA